MTVLVRTKMPFGVFVVLALLAMAQMAASQESSAALLRMQQSKAYLDISSNAKHAQGMQGITYGNPGDVWSYPNSLACLVVYGNGNYVLEKREEQTLGKPKIKSASGTLSADDLQQLKSILNDDAVKNLITPKPSTLPDDMETIRDVESLDLQIDRGGTSQRFTTVRQRIKTGAGNSMTANASSGMDTYLDNGTSFKKTLTPLMKWFEGLQKKNKSDLKEAKPQYCVPMNIG